MTKLVKNSRQRQVVKVKAIVVKDLTQMKKLEIINQEKDLIKIHFWLNSYIDQIQMKGRIRTTGLVKSKDDLTMNLKHLADHWKVQE